MPYTVVFSKLAQEKFDRLIHTNRKLGKQVAQAIDRIAADPDIGEFLKGKDWKGCRKYRSGDYRIIYRIEHAKLIVYLLTMGNRKEIYR